MSSYNRVILMGNLTRDIQLRYTPAGTPVTEVGLAINERRKGINGEKIEETVYVDVTLWGRTAEIAAEYLQKGSHVHIEGRLKLDSWDKDGQKQYKLKVVADSLQMLGSKGERSSTPRSDQRHSVAESDAAPETSANSGSGFNPEDIPF